MKLNGELVSNEIEKLGITKTEFCNRTGLKKYNLSKYLHGKNVPRNVAVRIADGLGLDLYEIIKITGFDY